MNFFWERTITTIALISACGLIAACGSSANDQSSESAKSSDKVVVYMPSPTTLGEKGMILPAGQKKLLHKTMYSRKYQ